MTIRRPRPRALAGACAAVLSAFAGCSSPPPTTNRNTADIASAATPTSTVNYAGRWTGVEGMFLDVGAAAQPERYRLTMQYDLDHHQTVDAQLVGDTLVFTRDGATKTLRPTDGAATGLKYLDGKKDCLTVAPGEGYCRD